MKKSFLANRGYAFLLLGAFLCLGLPVFFLNHPAWAGAFTLLGLALFMLAARFSSRMKETLFCCLAFSFSLTVRYGLAFFACGIVDSLISWVVFFLYAILLSSLFLLEYFLKRGKARFLVPFIFPAGYALVCFLACLLSLGSLLNPLTYLFCWSLLGGMLSYLTEFGLSFFLLLVASFLIEIFAVKERKRRIACGAISLVVFSSLLITSSLSISWNARPSYSLKVAMGLGEKQSTLGVHEGDFTVEDGFALLESELSSSTQESADLFITNEEFLSFPRSEEVTYLPRLSNLIAKYRIPTLLCTDETGSSGALSLNKLYFFSSDGEILSSYQKTSLIPVLEGDYEKGDGKPGSISTVLGGHNITLSYLICADLNNAFVARNIPSSTELLLVPSWDWDYVNAEQLRTACRAMECKTTMLKHTYEGYSFVATAKGDVLETQDNRGVYSTVRTIDVPIYLKA